MAFTDSDIRRFKLWRVLETAGEKVLRYTLLCGTDSKFSNVSLYDYLMTPRQSSTANFNKIVQKDVVTNIVSPSVFQKHLKKQFNKTEMIQIKKDQGYTDFDITLLHKVIKLICENVAKMDDPKWTTQSNEIEYLATEIKQYRNYVCHEKPDMNESDYLGTVNKLKDLFSKTLKATKDKYNRDDTELTDQMTNVMKDVDVVLMDQSTFGEILLRDVSNLLPKFKQEINEEIREGFKSAQLLHPLHILNGYKEFNVDIQDIFYKIVIKEESNIKENTKDERSGKKTIDHLKLLTQTRGGRLPSSPHLLIVEGDAGSGKTTLVTFLLAEWLKEESQRRMEGLQDFDILLWSRCRYERSSTLESLIKQTLPESFHKYGHLMLPLLKKLKVLITVDGLDEETESSRQLIDDILSHGKHCNNFTVVCTSRSEVKINTKVQENFTVFHTILEGLSTRDRKFFVEKHIELLNRDHPIDTTSLEQIVEREIFRLPLNLLFLSVMLTESQELLTGLTQTELYQNFVNYTVEKLHREVSRKERRFKMIKWNILRVIYRISLQTLLQGTAYAPEVDLYTLFSTCGNLCFPEVRSAFFTLWREVHQSGQTIRKYCMKHKGLQEFFAACYIIGCLSMHNQDIRRVLEDNTQGQDLQLTLIKNLLCVLLEMLSTEEEPKETAMGKTVDLIHESGVERTQEWLTALKDTMSHPCALERVASHVTDDDKEEVTVRESTVNVATDLLPVISRKTIKIDLEKDPRRVKDEFFQAIDKHSVEDLYLWHHYKQPHQSSTSAQLLSRCPRDGLLWFAGHLDAENVSSLPRFLRRLRLCLAGDEHARGLLPALQRVKDHCPYLRLLIVHVPVTSVTADSLTPLPPAPTASLVLSGVGYTEIEAACSTAAAMCPENERYCSISFPNASLDSGGCRRLLHGLAAAGVRVDYWSGRPGEGVRVPDTFVTEDEERDLKRLAWSLLRCAFFREPEDQLWSV